MDASYYTALTNVQHNNIFAISSQKGGVGKSTTAINISAYLCFFGFRTLLVDMDPQSNATIGVGIDYSINLKSVYDMLVLNESANNVTLRTSYKDLYILPGNWRLSDFERDAINLNGKEFRLKDSLEKIKNYYNYIIIDCPASLDLLTVNALTAAKDVIVPLQCEFFALEGISRLLRQLDEINRYLNNDLSLKGILLTMYTGTKIAKQVVKEAMANFPDTIFKTFIPKSTSLAEASSLGMPIIYHDPLGSAALAYKKLTQEIIDNAEKPAKKHYLYFPVKFADFWKSGIAPRHAMKRRQYMPRHKL